MDKKAFSFLVVGFLLGLILSGGFAALLFQNRSDGAGGKTVLRLAHVLPPQAPVHLGMEEFARLVGEKSGGTMEVQIFPSGQLGSETETLEQLQRGALAMIKSSSAAMEGFIPEMAVFGLPYVFRDEVHYWGVLEGEIGQSLLTAGTGVNVRGLCYYDAGARSFYTVGRPVLKPEDLAGLKIRTIPSQMAMDMIDVMGGAATPMPFGELYTGLQQGVVDGAENNPPSVYDSRHWEVAKHYSLDEHTRIPDVLLMSEAIWQSLTPVQQGWLMEAAHESVAYQRAVWQEYEADCLAALEKEGVTLYRPDKVPFQMAVAPLLERFEGTIIGDLAARIAGIK